MEGDKLKIDTLKNKILNNNNIEKSFEDIRNIATCDNYEELLRILRCMENRGKMTPGTNKVSFDVVLNKDFKSRIDAHQEQNGGRVEGVEFPFDEKATSPRWTPHSDNNILGVVKEVRTNLIPPREVRLPFDTPIQEEKDIAFGSKAEGIKETEGKLDYSEINLKILDLMAERFNANKDKYPKGNMKKPLNKDSLVWAAFRHIRKMLQPIKDDPETYKEHLAAVLCNMSMILDQEAFEND